MVIGAVFERGHDLRRIEAHGAEVEAVGHRARCERDQRQQQRGEFAAAGQRERFATGPGFELVEARGLLPCAEVEAGEPLHRFEFGNEFLAQVRRGEP